MLGANLDTEGSADFEVLLGNDAVKLLLFFLRDICLPIALHILARGQGFDERIDKVLLAAVMVLLYEFEDVVDVHIDLLDQLGLEDDAIVDGLPVGLLATAPLLVQRCTYSGSLEGHASSAHRRLRRFYQVQYNVFLNTD